MKKRLTAIICFLVILVSNFLGCGNKVNLNADFSVGGNQEKNIIKVENYADITGSYSYYDYKKASKDLVNVIYSFTKNEQAVLPSYTINNPSSWSPIGMWIDALVDFKTNPLQTGYLQKRFSLPTYVGDNRFLARGGENITMIASVLGSTYAGVDMSNFKLGQTAYDMVEMTLAGYNTGTKLVTNAGTQGQSFWYDVFPQILFARLYAEYTDTEYMKEMVVNGANEWLEALPNFVKNGEVNYEFVGYDVVNESVTEVGDHIEPPNGGLAFLFYSAYKITGEQKYLSGAKEVLDYLQTYQKNPNYEALTDYAPLIASILNRDYGCNYDIGKFIDYLFEGDSAFRSGWCVLDGNFGDYSVNGLVGQSGDYAFSMNTFHLAAVLANTVKYDTRYADIVGKYLLNVVNNSKVFFPQNMPLDKQTMNSYLTFDKSGSLCYEGFRNWYGGYAMGDATTMFGQPCDLSLYSSVFIGMLGGMVEQTNINGVLRYDLNTTDSYGANDYPTYLIYNPYKESKTVIFESNNSSYDLFDSTNGVLLGRNLSGNTRVIVPAESSVILMQVPAMSEFVESDNKILVNGVAVYSYKPSVEVNLRSRQTIYTSTDINIKFSAGKGDSVKNMKIYFGDILVYDDEPISTFRYDKSLLPNTDYTLKIEIETEKGAKDYVTKRVVAL